MVEQRTLNPLVRGSSPRRPTNREELSKQGEAGVSTMEEKAKAQNTTSKRIEREELSLIKPATLDAPGYKLGYVIEQRRPSRLRRKPDAKQQ